MRSFAESRMTRHLLFPVLINASGKLSRIVSQGNQATKYFNNLLNNFFQVVKINEDSVGDISKRSATSSFNSPSRNRINAKRNSSWGFNDIGIFFLPVIFKIHMASEFTWHGIIFIIDIIILFNLLFLVSD